MSRRADFDPQNYATVAERIRDFYVAHPLGRIITQLVSRDDYEVVFRAMIYRDATEPHPAATGWAAEREGDSEINLIACLENTETSAIGRALANLGFTASRARPSGEKMAKAVRARERNAAGRKSGNDRVALHASGQRPPPPSAASRPSPPTDDMRLEQEANNVVDALGLVRAAERLGLRAARGARLRARLVAGTMSSHGRERWTALLRRWIEKRRNEALTDLRLS